MHYFQILPGHCRSFPCFIRNSRSGVVGWIEWLQWLHRLNLVAVGHVWCCNAGSHRIPQDLGSGMIWESFTFLWAFYHFNNVLSHFTRNHECFRGFCTILHHFQAIEFWPWKILKERCRANRLWVFAAEECYRSLKILYRLPSPRTPRSESSWTLALIRGPFLDKALCFKVIVSYCMVLSLDIFGCFWFFLWKLCLSPPLSAKAAKVPLEIHDAQGWAAEGALFSSLTQTLPWRQIAGSKWFQYRTCNTYINRYII